MNPYKHWSGEFRNKSLRLTNKAKELGWIVAPGPKCSVCGTTVKKIEHHNNDYDVTYYTLKEVFARKPISISDLEKQAVQNALQSVCRSCHLKIHKEERIEAEHK